MKKKNSSPLHLRRTSKLAGEVVLAAAALIAVFVCLGNVHKEKYALAVAAFAFAVFCINTIAFARANVASATTGAGVRRWINASTVRYNPVSLRLLVAVTSSLSIGVISMGFTPTRKPAMLLVALGLLLASFLIPIMLRSIRNGFVELSPDGIRFRGWAFDITVPWRDVRTVRVVVEQYPVILVVVDELAAMNRRYTTRFWRIELMPIGQYFALDSRRFAIHPTVLEQWIRFYVDYPAARVELGTDASAERLANITVPSEVVGRSE